MRTIWRIPTTPPPLPIDMETAREHCRIHAEDTSHDQRLGIFLGAAAAVVERDTRQAFGLRAITGQIRNSGHGCIELPVGPFAELVSIEALDEAGNVSALTADDWEAADDCTLVTKLGRTPPTCYGFKISYKAGHAALPQDKALLALTLVAHWFEHPEAVTAAGEAREVPLGYEHIARAMDPMRDAVR